MRFPESLRSLRSRDLRLFFAGQAVSLTGTWMQSVAQSWLMHRLDAQAVVLGALGFLGQIPFFFLSFPGGALADRLPRRSLVIATQVAAAVQAALLAWVTLAGAVTTGQVLAFAVVLGVIGSFDVPARQAYLTDMAGEDLANAIAMNATLFYATGVVGPALSGYVVLWLGEGSCFLLNALSFMPVIAALVVIRTPSARTELGSRANLREGVEYATRTPHVRMLLALFSFASLAGSPYVVLMPVFAKDVLGGGSALLGRLMACVSTGALVSSILLLRLDGLKGLFRRVAWGASLFALGLVGLAAASGPRMAAAALFLAGFGQLMQLGSTNILLQSLAPKEMRGRLMGLYSMMFGVTPFGSLALGLLADRIGPRATVATGAAILGAASLAFHAVLPRLERLQTPARPVQ